MDVLLDALHARGSFSGIPHKDRLRAAELCLDRGWGKAIATSISVSADAGSLPESLAGAGDALLEALARRLAPGLPARLATVEIAPAAVESAVKTESPDTDLAEERGSDASSE